MSTHGWSITYPQVIAFGARALAVPARGNVMCASAVVPFRLADGELVKPAEWYSAVREHAGEQAVPDAVAPLPGAELLLLGPVGPFPREPQEGRIRCGAVDRRLLLCAGPEDDGPLFLGADTAVWHERDNPLGRDGSDAAEPPLIRDRDRPGRPVWLGPTAHDHPLRHRHFGIPGEGSMGDWPGDAGGAALHDAHAAFWADGLFARDPLRLSGIVDRDIDVDLPPYRVSLTVCHGVETDWRMVESRIHVVAVVPMAGIGAAIWRGSIDLGGDVMGEEVVAVVAALDEADAPPRNPEDLAEVVALRWQDPALALDDRPLLPPSLHHLVELPFEAPPEGTAHDARQAAAQAWAVEEMGLDRNPYEDVPLEGDAFAASAEEASQDAMDVDKMTEVADAVAEHAKERHRAMGFGDVAPPDPRPAVPRGDVLEEEVTRRLAQPYQTQHELAIAASLDSVPSGLDAGETLAKLAQTRTQSPEVPLFWPPLLLDEAVYFGEALLGRLADGDLPRHVDASGAQVGDAPVTDPRLAPPDGEEEAYVWDGARPPPMATPGTLASLERRHAVRRRRVDGLLAEETGWRGVVFEGCEFVECSFAKGRFENCEFVECTWERVNITDTTFVDCRFESCSLTRLTAGSPALMACEFNDCRLEDMSVPEVAMRDVTFGGGAWAGVQWEEGLFVNVRLEGMEIDDVTFTMVRAVHIVFERVAMQQVSAMARGFPYATLRDVQMHRCGFVGFHFDSSVWEAVRAEESGLTNCVFAEAAISRDCEFRRCDFTGAAFAQADVGGARFVECTMSFTAWNGAAAEGAWFLGSNLRGVHFSDARLAGAVFCDADIRDAVFKEEELVGADFSGTQRSE